MSTEHSRARSLAAALAFVALGSACGGEETGIELTVTSEVAIDQIAVEGSAGPGVVFQRALAPSQPREIGAAGETLVILVDDSLDGREVRLRVEGLERGDVVTAEAEATVAIARGRLVRATARLTAPVDLCGGVECADDQVCVDERCVCDAEACEGCCDADQRCQPGTTDGVCGAGGGACQACPDDETCEGGVCSGCSLTCDGCCSGSTCEASADEHCGVDGVACTLCSMRAPTCVNGTCQCQDQPACTPGQACSNGMCVCTAASCPDGCCEGNECRIRSFDSCGYGGNECTACDPQLADGCSSTGACTCSGNAGCSPGEYCVDGACYCGGSSCPNGCCQDGTCHDITSASFCGLNGSECVACEVDRADGCVDGQCACGDGAACGPNQVCVAHACACTAASCPTGCCDGDTCATITFEHCGDPGGPCTACDPVRADTCSGGDCLCGDEPQCAEGQRCDPTRGCVCDAASCTGCCDAVGFCHDDDDPDACGSGGAECVVCTGGQPCDSGVCANCRSGCLDGCCSGTECNRPPTHEACAIGGDPCVACGPRSDRCEGGECSCGVGGTPCAPGQHCLGGVCRCTAESCPTGCCDGDTCQARAPATCGTAGGPCTDCGVVADTCTNTGACACGSGAVCGDGQRCIGGGCRCDSTSCPGGCCAGATCHAPPELDFCGTLGEVCEVCNDVYADNCGDGDCHCGPDDRCNAHQVCTGGECRCTATSCPTGCCADDECMIEDPRSCGSGGGACVTCDPIRSDRCIDGTCRCGTMRLGPCPEGRECIEGRCTCGPRVCDGCCDASEVCILPVSMNSSRCGSAGMACDDCGSGTGTEPLCVGGVCALLDCESCEGCCSGTHCVEPGDSDLACGHGVVCGNCFLHHSTCGDDRSCEIISHGWR